MTSTNTAPNALPKGTVVMLDRQWNEANSPNSDFQHWQIQKFVVIDSDGFFKVEVELAEDPSVSFWIDRAKLKAPLQPEDFFD